MRIKVYYLIAKDDFSTDILGRLLAQQTGVVLGGKLTDIAMLWTPDACCGCEKKISACEFWQKVKLHWLKLTGLPDVEQYNQLQAVFESPIISPKDLELLIHQQRDQFTTYSRYTHQLFEAIERVCNKVVIVDSSNNINRAYLLSRMITLDVKFVSLVRDPRIIFPSLESHMAQQSIRTTMLSWVSQIKEVEAIFHCITEDDFCIVRLEDLLANAETELIKVGSLHSLSLEESVALVKTEGALKTSHNLPGKTDITAFQEFLFRRIETTSQNSLSGQFSFLSIAYWKAREYSYSRDLES